MHIKESSTLLKGCTQLAHWQAMTKDVNAIKSKINQSVDVHTTESAARDHFSHDIDTQCHPYASQVNRQHINILIDATEKTHQDITTLYNIMHSLYSSIQLPSNHPTHQIHLGQPQRFITLHVRNSPSHHLLYWCCHYRNILATHSTCPRYKEDAEVYWGYTPFHNAPANLL